ncbi:MAG: NAD(P)/FAD-dependent oxidoreductase [Fusobacteriota bacterium]
MENKVYDVVIVGAGPAGLSAALYTSRANLSVLVLEKEGQGALLSAHKIANYPGAKDNPSGKELYNRMKDHAKQHGAEFVDATFLELETMESPKVVKTSVDIYKAESVIIATGFSKSKEQKLPGEDEFIGKGVSYCATCDGAFFKGMDVSVFGNGEEALEEALFLTKHVKKVYFFVNDEKLIGDSELINSLKEKDNIEILYNHELKEISGGDFVEKVEVINDSGDNITYDVAAVFLYLGTKSNTQLFSTFANLNEQGRIETKENMQTLVDGVYAAGDVRAKPLMQVVTAASDGAIAATEVIKHVMKQKKNKK